MRVFLRTGAVMSLAVASVWAATGSSDSPTLYRGEKPALYVQLNATTGNIAALQKINRDFSTMIRAGTTPDSVGFYSAHPLHPVNETGPMANAPVVPGLESVPIAPAPTSEAAALAGQSLPGDIQQSANPSLKDQFFKGYKTLPETRTEKVLGDTNPQLDSSVAPFVSSNIGYYLDTVFQKSKTFVMYPQSAVLTVSFQGDNKDEDNQAAAYLQSIRDTVLAAIQPLLSETDILNRLGDKVTTMVDGWAHANGWTDFVTYAVVNTINIAQVTTADTIATHEVMHALDFQQIGLGQSAILPAYLVQGNPLYDLTDALMEVRALLAEINFDPYGDTVNILYGQMNASRLANALKSALALPPALLQMAKTDLAAAQAWLAAHVSEYINF